MTDINCLPYWPPVVQRLHDALCNTSSASSFNCKQHLRHPSVLGNQRHANQLYTAESRLPSSHCCATSRAGKHGIPSLVELLNINVNNMLTPLSCCKEAACMRHRTCDGQMQSRPAPLMLHALALACACLVTELSPHWKHSAGLLSWAYTATKCQQRNMPADFGKPLQQPSGHRCIYTVTS
jgi:hypothetical protein